MKAYTTDWITKTIPKMIGLKTRTLNRNSKFFLKINDTPELNP